jgi:hypothetical protein
MAVSGSQKTRIGQTLSGTAKKLTITAKAEGIPTDGARKKQAGMLRRVGRVNQLG